MGSLLHRSREVTCVSTVAAAVLTVPAVQADVQRGGHPGHGGMGQMAPSAITAWPGHHGFWRGHGFYGGGFGAPIFDYGYFGGYGNWNSYGYPVYGLPNPMYADPYGVFGGPSIFDYLVP